MTYGVNAPLGLQTASYGLSAPFTGAIQKFPITAAYATSLYIGDLVTIANTGLLVRYTAGDGAANPPIGVFIGCSYVDATGVYQFSKYWPASTVVKVGTTPVADVITDPNTIFTIQATATVVTANIANNADVTFATAGSAATGQSGMQLDTTTINTTETLPLHIIAFDPIPGNVSGVTYNNVLVKMNNTLINAGATGV